MAENLPVKELGTCAAALTLTPSWTRRGRDIRNGVPLPAPANEQNLLYYAEVGPTLQYLETVEPQWEIDAWEKRARWTQAGQKQTYYLNTVTNATKDEHRGARTADLTTREQHVLAYRKAMEGARALTRRAPRGVEYEARAASNATQGYTWAKAKTPAGTPFSVYHGTSKQLRRYIALDASYVDHPRCLVR
jgi:hypothetical protein